MRRLAILTTTTFLLIAPLAWAVLAQEAGSEAVSEVLDVLERYRQDIVACRTEAFAASWAEGSTVFISSGNPLLPSDEYLRMWGDVCAGGGGMTIGPVEETVTMLGEGAALVTGTMGYSFTAPGGEVHSGTTRTTAVLRDVDGEWKLVHAHGSELGAHGGMEA